VRVRRELGRTVRRVRRRAPGAVRAGRQVLDRLPPSVEQPLRAKLKRLAG
jgi:hypothetical protein